MGEMKNGLAVVTVRVELGGPNVVRARRKP
jgi:hypothetical protein